MGRPISGTMASILSPASRDIDMTIDIVFSDATAFHYATSPLTAVNGNDYTNDLETVGEVRQTLAAPTDNVAIGIQNKDRLIGLHVSQYWQKWRSAMAVVGRYYYQIGSTGTRTGTNQWIEMFRGAVQRPIADDQQVTFDIVPDTVSPGQIVAQRNEAPLCPFIYKDAKTCAYAGGLTSCDHTLKGLNGCDVHANSHHFGGFEHRYNPDLSVPGTGGGGGGDGGGGGGDGDHLGRCPRLDQFVRVKGHDGSVMPKMVGFVTDDDWIWNPIRRVFYRVKRAVIIRDQPIWAMMTEIGAVGYSSSTHPIIQTITDANGLAVDAFRPGDLVMAESVDLIATRCLYAVNTGKTGDVMQISIEAETVAEKIYCYGDRADKMIVCHNTKPPFIEY